jgi:hypothetical protein
LLADNIQKKSFIRKISSQTEEHKHNISRNVELSIWIGLIWLRCLSVMGYKTFKLQKRLRIFFCLWIPKYSAPLKRIINVLNYNAKIFITAGNLLFSLSLSLSLSNGTRARGGPRPPSRVSSILPGLGRLLSNSCTLVLQHRPSHHLPSAT